MRSASVLIPRSTSQESNGPGTAPSDFCRKRRRSATVGSFVRREAADDVGMAAEVLRRRVDDDVGAELERTLQVRRRERVVDDEERAGRVCGLGGGGDVHDVEHRVRRRLDPHHPRGVVEMVGEVRELLGRQVVEAVALRLVDLRGHPVDAAVDVGDENDPVARIEEVHERRRRAEPGGVGNAVLGGLERGERGLERAPGRVRDARVVVALVLADRVLDVRRRLVDRRDDRAGRGIRLLADVDCARLEVHQVDANQPSRLPRGSARSIFFWPGSHQTPLTSSRRVFRSETGSMRPTIRSPRRMGRT